MLTPRDIVRQYRKEKEQKTLTKLDDNFYSSAKKLIDGLAMNVRKLKAEGKSDAEINEASEDVENARRIILDLIRMRRRKIINELFSSILISSERPAVDLPNMTAEERQWCNSILDATQAYNITTIKEILEAGRISEDISAVAMPLREKEKISYEDVPIVVAVVREDIESITDEANFQWPGIPKETIIGAPSEMVKKLVDAKKAEILLGGE